MTQVLYNLRTSDPGYRITKFTDGEVESSYLTSDQACDCPAGHRASCRHRAMLPELFPIRDTQWFYNYDSGAIVDLMGTPKPACAPAEQDTERQTRLLNACTKFAEDLARPMPHPDMFIDLHAALAGQHTAAESEAYGTGPLMQAMPLMHEWNALPEEERARASSRHVEERMGYESKQTVRASPAWRRL